jgi:chromosome segregation protein
MDPGAHFSCCDLQVHTPRDRNWKGQCPISDADRKKYASEFVSACRAKGLNVVAITDHHDMGFLPYLRQAAEAETEPTGKPLKVEKLVVLAGVELTLAVPCQALLIFDPDLSDSALKASLHALGIEPASPSDPKTIETVKLRFRSLEEIYEALDALPSLKNHYALLPNVNDSGRDTILRADFSEHYKTMPCVGGYVDGQFEGHGRRLIVEGKDPAWGNKKIGVIQTSDSREAGFPKLGETPTWIKWSSPSAEGIRQACLSPASRLRYRPPLIPDTWISEMEVSDSKFFGKLSIKFNPQANMIIGGRGTGKSTILEYLRWALCDQPYVHSGEGEGELPDFERRRRTLVSGTLEPTHGQVSVLFLSHGVPHRIRREAGTNRVFLRVGEGPEQEAPEALIQSLAPIQGYSQKQLSHVSVRTQELERLLTTPIAQQLSALDAELKSLASSLRQAFEKCETKRLLQEQLQSVQVDLASKKEQADALTQQVKDLPEDQRTHITAHPEFSKGERIAAAYSSSFTAANFAIETSRKTVQKLLDELPSTDSTLPRTELEEIRKIAEARLSQAIKRMDLAMSEIGSAQDASSPLFDEASAKLAAHKQAYDAASSENKVVQERLSSLRLISEQVAGCEKDRTALGGRLAEIQNAETQLNETREKWLGVVGQKRALIAKQAQVLSGDSGDQLRVTIGSPQKGKELIAAIHNAVSGAALTRPEKIEFLVSEVLAHQVPVSAWLDLCEEMIGLARVGPRLDSGAALPLTPRFSRAQFAASELGRIARKLKPNIAFSLSLIYPESAPIFEYKMSTNNYIPFRDASPGQQATALINLLLNQSAGALVVDQPEDDLDNLTIMRVAEQLWGAKEKRQIIFSTHNPNLVVIGDAELVLHCAYAVPGKLEIRDRGAIDRESICQVIAEVMEGGAEAFGLRKKKYGF